MALETATFLSQLVATNPTSSDPISQGDDHLRLVKSVLQNSFTGITGAVTMTHTELNTVTARGLIAGQTWTGTHTFPATTFGVTAAFGASGTAYATLDYVNAVATNAALPGQTGNDYKFLRTVAGVAGWAELGNKGANIASAATINLTIATGDFVHVTGTTTITAITIPVGAERTVVFDGILTLTHGAALLLPGGVSITTAANDRMTVRGDTSGAIVVGYHRSSGLPIVSTAPGLILIATLTPTAAANLDFLTTFTSAYDNYLIVCDGLLPSATDRLNMRMAVAGAADSSASYYNNSATSGNVTVAQTALLDQLTLTGGRGANLLITVLNSTGTAAMKTIISDGNSQSDATPTYNRTLLVTSYTSASAASGFRLYWNAGSNFTATGKVRVYGISNT